MAIPLSNDQEVIQATRTADIKPVDVTPILNNMAKSTLQMSRQAQETAQSGIKLGQNIINQQDVFKRNEAERIYKERTSQLNTQLSQTQGEERVKFQPKYEAEMKLASDEYTAAINKISSFEIREASRNSVNAWNQHNASTYQYENYKNSLQLQEKSTAQALVTDAKNRYDLITSVDNAKSLRELFLDPNLGVSHGDEMIRDFYGRVMGEPDEVVEQRIQDYHAKSVQGMAIRLAQARSGLDPRTDWTESEDFINWAQVEGLIDKDDAIETKRAIQDKKLDTIARLYPGELLTNGVYSLSKAKAYAKDLDDKELLERINTGSSGSSSGASAASKEVVEEMSMYALDNMYNYIARNLPHIDGLIPKDKHPEQYDPNYGTKEWYNTIASKKEDTKKTLQDISTALSMTNFGINQRFAVNPITNESLEVEESGANSENNLKKRGFKILNSTSQKEFLRIQNSLLSHLHSIWKSGKLDEILNKRGDSFDAEQTHFLKEVRRAFEKDDLPKNSTWYNIKKYGFINGFLRFDETKHAQTPMNIQLNTILNNSKLASGVASNITGIPSNSSFSLTTQPVQARSLQENEDTQSMEWTIDQNLPKVTYNQVYTYEMAKRNRAELGQKYMEMFQGETTADKVASAFAHPELSKELDEISDGVKTYNYAEGMHYINTAVRGITVPGKMLNWALDKTVGDLYKSVSPADQTIWSGINAIKNIFTSNIEEDKKETTLSLEMQRIKKHLLENNAAELTTSKKENLEGLIYDMEQGDMPDGTKSISQVYSDGRAVNQEQYDNYINRHDNINRTINDVIDRNGLLLDDANTRIFMINNSDMKRALDNMNTSIVMGSPNPTPNIGLQQIISSAIEVEMPATPVSDIKRIQSIQSDNIDFNNANMVFMTEEGNNYVLHDGWLEYFSCEPSKFYSILGMMNTFKHTGNYVPSTVINTSNIKLNKEQMVALLSVPDKDIPFDFR